MTQPDIARSFDTSAALAMLDSIRSSPLAVRPYGTDEAWDTAWIACLTSCPMWAGRSEDTFSDVLTEIAGMVRPPPRPRTVPASPLAPTERDRLRSDGM